MGIDGLLIETHPNPKVAKSDAEQQLDFPQFRALHKSMNAVAEAVGRKNRLNTIAMGLHYRKKEEKVVSIDQYMSKDKYLQRGVSASKEDVHAAVKDLYHGLYPKAFCKVYPDYMGGDEAWCNVMSADGSGTKSILAYLYWRETGDITVWARHTRRTLSL